MVRVCAVLVPAVKQRSRKKQERADKTADQAGTEEEEPDRDSLAAGPDQGTNPDYRE